MKKIIIIVLIYSFFTACNSKSDYHVISEVPDLTMPENYLKFREIKDYKNYKIVGTHFRTDKNELRYILANEKAFRAYNEGNSFPEDSKIVKIGWDVKKMSNFSPALEANQVLRIEYMIKDSTKFKNNPGNWGYARFVKIDGKYKSWNKGTNSCISCHNLAKSNDYLFTKFQVLQ